MTHQGPKEVNRSKILETTEQIAGDGLRALGFAMRVWDSASRSADFATQAETGLVFIGIVGMMDPPRPEAVEAVAICSVRGHPAGDDHREIIR
ncbi:MAG: hypothetical protein U5R30_16035 [Deltaproteobacteria bacterium]|nr:hypothetical protein [Deltaproteobacteria bacterium]